MVRIAFFITLLAIFMMTGMISSAFAGSSPYQVKGVEVDILDENAVKARGKAFNEAQRKAFEILATRYFAEGELKELKIPSDQTLSSFIQDFKITSEQTSTKRYKGIFDFRFKANAVNQHFGRGPINYTDDNSDQAKKYLLIPFYHEEKKTVVFNKAQNPFWGSLLQEAEKYPNIVLPEGNIQDMTDVGNKNPNVMSPVIFRRLKARYDVSGVMVAIAHLSMLDQSKVQVELLDASSGELSHFITFESAPDKIGLATMIATNELTKPQSAQTVVAPTEEATTPEKTDVVPESEINPEHFMADPRKGRRTEAGRQMMIQKALENRQSMRKAERLQAARDKEAAFVESEDDGAQAEVGEINVQVFFETMDEWVATQKELSRLAGLKGIRIVTLKTSSADTVIEYSDWNKLLKSIRASGLTLVSDSADSYTLKRSGSDF